MISMVMWEHTQPKLGGDNDGHVIDLLANDRKSVC